jgi:ubiquinone/menaquinone biosynthesis C-methylase UbiE
MASGIHTAASSGYKSAHTTSYNAVRSGYTPAIADYVIQLTTPQTSPSSRPLKVLDLGAGTGKWTVILRDALIRCSIPCNVVAIDPVESMIEKLHELLPDIETIVAPAHKLPFPSASIDLVTAATALHWFANADSLKEIHRVLKPGAWFVVVMYDWNERHDWTPAMGAYLDSFYEDGTPYVKHGVWKTALSGATKEGLFEESVQRKFSETLISTFNRETIIDRFASASKIAALPPKEKEKVRQQFRKIVETNGAIAGKEELLIMDDVNVYCLQAKHLA